MESINKYILLAVPVIVIGFFIGGVIYADKTCNIPKDGNFEVDGYFSNIKKTNLTIFDGDYPYFTNGTGASEEEAKDYDKHPENYAEYTVKLIVKNNSNYDINPVWAVLPGYRANYEKVTLKSRVPTSNRRVWINCWLSEGVVSIAIGETYETNLQIIVKKVGMSDKEIQNLLEHLQINLQLGICEKSLNSQYDISRNIFFNYPVYYKHE